MDFGDDDEDEKVFTVNFHVYRIYLFSPYITIA